MLTKISQSYQLRQTRACTGIHQLSSASFATCRNALHQVRKGSPGADRLVQARRLRLQRNPTHQTPNPRLRPRRQSSRPTRLDLRETPRLDRRLPVDRRRNPHLGLHLLVLDRGARRQHEDLLRSGPRN